MPTDSDVLDPDDVIAEIVGDDDEPVESEGTTLVCDYVGDDGVCGESFPTARQLGAHKWGKHKVKGSYVRPTKGGSKKGPADKRPGAKKTSAPKQAAVKASGPASDRAGTYTASLAMASLAAYLALPPFNQADLDICNAGAPNIGRALANLADHNQSVARATDLILGGGAGGDWIAVIMAVVPVVGALAANHGVIPATSGARFGEMIGVVPVAPTAGSRVAPEHDAGSQTGEGPPGYPVDNDRTADDVIAFFAGTPETVLTDAMTKMMSMGGEIQVAVPFNVTHDVTENPDGHSGSEQLKPVIPEAEDERGDEVQEEGDPARAAS